MPRTWTLVRVDAVPITSGGVASYNVENAVAAAAMAEGLGLGDEAIVRGLCGFQTSDNPRRGELIDERASASFSTSVELPKAGEPG